VKAAPDADAQAVLEAVLRVRDWVNTPTEDMGRSSWDIARELAAAHGAQVRSSPAMRCSKQLPDPPCGRPRLAPRAAHHRTELGRRNPSAAGAGRQGRVLRHRRP
jgi:hypothetical protein